MTDVQLSSNLGHCQVGPRLATRGLHPKRARDDTQDANRLTCRDASPRTLGEFLSPTVTHVKRLGAAAQESAPRRASRPTLTAAASRRCAPDRVGSVAQRAIGVCCRQLPMQNHRAVRFESPTIVNDDPPV